MIVVQLDVMRQAHMQVHAEPCETRHRRTIGTSCSQRLGSQRLAQLRQSLQDFTATITY